MMNASRDGCFSQFCKLQLPLRTGSHRRRYPFLKHHKLHHHKGNIMPIHFGTDGWRAVISDTFTFDNLRIVAQAIADAVGSDYWNTSGNGAGVIDPKKI